MRTYTAQQRIHNRNRVKNLYKKRVSEGTCVKCGKEKIDPDYKTMCSGCGSKERDRSLSKSKKQSAAWRAEGKCTGCGKERSPNKLKCETCLNRIRVINSNRSKLRKANGQCYVCANPVDPNVSSMTIEYVLCVVCYMKRMARLHLNSAEDGPKLQALFDKQNGLCAYTKEKLILGDNASIDHITPISRGGDDSDIANLQWVTWTVNNCKRNLTHDEWITLCRKVSS